MKVHESVVKLAHECSSEPMQVPWKPVKVHKYPKRVHESAMINHEFAMEAYGSAMAVRESPCTSMQAHGNS